MNAAFEVPSHIPPERVIDFDFANVPGATVDPHLAWKKLHHGPDIVWTPHYGGHWIATRAEDIELIQKDHEHFSHREFTLPKMPKDHKPFPLAPLELDRCPGRCWRAPRSASSSRSGSSAFPISRSSPARSH